MEKSLEVKTKLSEKISNFFLLSIRPIVIAITGSFLWYLLHKSMRFGYEDREVFQPLLGFIFGLHCFIAGLQINSASDRSQKMKQAKSLRDKRRFEEYACIRVSDEVQGILFILSVSIFFAWLFYPFYSTYAGLITVWITLFIMCYLWESAVEMSNPFKGISKITPEEFKEIFEKEEKA